MTVLITETYFTKSGKESEFKSLLQKWRKYMKDNREKLKEMKSWKIYIQTFGNNAGAHVEQVEFDSLAEFEKFNDRLKKDKEFMKLDQETMAIIDNTTLSINVWSTEK